MAWQVVHQFHKASAVLPTLPFVVAAAQVSYRRNTKVTVAADNSDSSIDALWPDLCIQISIQ